MNNSQESTILTQALLALKREAGLDFALSEQLPLGSDANYLILAPSQALAVEVKRNIRAAPRPTRLRHLKQSAIVFFNFDTLKETVDREKAKAYFEKVGGVAMLPFKLNMRIDKFLKQFILKETDDLLLVAETNLGDEGKPL